MFLATVTGSLSQKHIICPLAESMKNPEDILQA